MSNGRYKGKGQGTYIDAHEHIVELKVCQSRPKMYLRSSSYLLVTDGEFPLCLLVLLRKCLELLDGLCLRDRNAELDIGLGILMTGLERVSTSLSPIQKDNPT